MSFYQLRRRHIVDEDGNQYFFVFTRNPFNRRLAFGAAVHQSDGRPLTRKQRASHFDTAEGRVLKRANRCFMPEQLNHYDDNLMGQYLIRCFHKYGVCADERELLTVEFCDNNRELRVRDTKWPCRPDETLPIGFMKPMKVSAELGKFLNLEYETKQFTRPTVMGHFLKYVKKHDLQNPINSKVILPNEELLKLVGDVKEELTFFNIMKYLSHHFSYPENKVPDVSPVTVAEDGDCGGSYVNEYTLVETE